VVTGAQARKLMNEYDTGARVAWRGLNAPGRPTPHPTPRLPHAGLARGPVHAASIGCCAQLPPVLEPALVDTHATAPKVSHALVDIDGRRSRLRHGDTIGWSPDCQLVVPADTVSRRHAEVVERDGALVLRRLRGELWVDGRPVEEQALQAGARVRLGEDVELHVLGVALADRQLVLHVRGRALVVAADHLGLVLDPDPRLVTHPSGDLALRFEIDGVERVALLPDGRRHLLVPGDRLTLGAETVHIGERRSVPTANRHTLGRPKPTLRVDEERATVQAPHWPREERIPLSDANWNLLFCVGQVCAGAPTARWDDVARLAYPRREDNQLRKNYDKAISDLRDRLKRLDLPDVLRLERGRVGFDRAAWRIRFKA